LIWRMVSAAMISECEKGCRNYHSKEKDSDD
jgi:hypothetical protein